MQFSRYLRSHRDAAAWEPEHEHLWLICVAAESLCEKLACFHPVVKLRSHLRPLKFGISIVALTMKVCLFLIAGRPRRRACILVHAGSSSLRSLARISTFRSTSSEK